jgi:HAD superfamily hydrolase (TIGR01509 family)
MTVRALLFDFDGLVIDTEGPSYRAWAEVYDRHGHELPLETWSAAVCEVEELRPGVAELLDEADRRGIPAAIVTSASDWWIEHHLVGRGLLDRFAAVIAANGDRTRAKPLPTLYREALELLDVAAGEAVAFEDSPNGIAAAKAAGIYCVAVPNGVTGTLDLSAADRVVGSLLEFDLEEER